MGVLMNGFPHYNGTSIRENNPRHVARGRSILPVIGIIAAILIVILVIYNLDSILKALGSFLGAVLPLVCTIALMGWCVIKLIHPN